MSHGAMCLGDKVCASRKGGTREVGGCQGTTTRWGATSIVESASSFRRPFWLHFWNIHHNHATKTGPDVEDQSNSYIRQLKPLPAMPNSDSPLYPYFATCSKQTILLLLSKKQPTLIDAKHVCLPYCLHCYPPSSSCKEGTKFVLAKWKLNS